MDLSIVIVNYNTKELTKNCIDSIVKNTQGIAYEIIVVDNASSDESVDYLRNAFLTIQLIENEKNYGFARANNQGIKIAKGKYILLLNSDTIVLGDCLKKVKEFMDGREDAGIAGCKVLNKNGSLQYSCYHNPSFLSELFFFTKGIIKDFWDPVTYFHKMKYWGHNSIKAVDCVSGCFMMIKREVFNRIGLLDENFFMYYEDVEFCLKAREKTNYRIFYFFASKIIHLGSMSADVVDYVTLSQCYRSAFMYIKEFYGIRVARIWSTLCKLCWRGEIFLFYLFWFIPRVKQKREMLQGLGKL